MIDGWIILSAAFGYVGFLFALAWMGDRRKPASMPANGRPLIYSLSLAVYCTSWTFFGSVGLAASSGMSFLAVYLGAILMIVVGAPIVRRIIALAKSQNITSIADFIAARYGKNQVLASLVTVIAVAGTIPYIALQLKATSSSVAVMLGPLGEAATPELVITPLGDIAFTITLSMAAFAILFGTRQIDATEHQDGLMLAIATESVIKLLAFITVGIFVTYWMFDGFGDLWARANASQSQGIRDVLSRGFDASRMLAITFLSFVCILLLPRQFHVTVVENHDPREIRTATWLFPLYLVLINIFVLPIALAGLVSFPNGSVDADMFVLALPLSQGANTIAMIGFVGGLSAATAMVIVATIALAIMVCNDIVVPMMLRRGAFAHTDREEIAEIGPLLLNIRRIIIFAILLLAYGFHRTISQSQALASIGLLSFTAIAQFSPAFFAGLVWRRATSAGATAGISAGFAMWGYTMFLPWIARAGWVSGEILREGPFGIAALRPEHLFGLDLSALVHGVFVSTTVNVLVFTGVSFLRYPRPIERLQARLFVQTPLAELGRDNLPDPHDVTRSKPAFFSDAAMPGSTSFFRLWRNTITMDDLMRTAARYLGAERARRSFEEFAERRNRPLIPESEADVQALSFTEHLLASAIGAASSRLVLSLLLRRQNVGHRSALKLLDDASEAIQYNRDLLQSALDEMGQGISVFDEELQLICWNRRFRELLDIPPEFGRVGVPLDQILRYKAKAGHYDETDTDKSVADRFYKIAETREVFQDHNRTIGPDGAPLERVLEISTSPMPQGGVVTTYTDITERVEAAAALSRANETLERRVTERTAQLTELNKALEAARRKADEANLDKTRFLAAAGHDILQPLNAARLYVSSLTERTAGTDAAALASNVDVSLEAVEEILAALLDISRLDAGAMTPEVSAFPLHEIFDRLSLEFAPVARAKGLDLRFVDTGLWVHSDRRLLRRMLQNFVSNAIKYTPEGRVRIGCRRHGDNVTVEVHDTGPGIADEDHETVFVEFERLSKDAVTAGGLGLGLSIVQRIGRVLNHPIKLESTPERGSVFSVCLPVVPAQPRRERPDRTPVPNRNLEGCRVVCIDNEPEIVRSMELLLEGWGCEVQGAESGQAILASLEAGGTVPDIILADYHLNDSVGSTAIDAIRQKAGEHVPAIIITADRSPEVLREAQERDCVLMRKPIRPAALRATLHQLRRRAMAAE